MEVKLEVKKMPTKILDGKIIAAEISQQLKKRIIQQKLSPRLAIILCGEDPASVLYITMKKKACEEIGIQSELHTFPETISASEICSHINRLQKEADGIIIQLPLPVSLEKHKFSILNSIDPAKDVDGLTATSLGKIAQGNLEGIFVSATVQGIISLLDTYKIQFQGKNVTIINHSALIGKPLSLLLLQRGATVTICHEFTPDLSAKTNNADILISATGVPGLIKKEMVKQGAVVVDVGISKNASTGKVQGDVDFYGVQDIANFIAPVPGGVGPMTIAQLLLNVVESSLRRSVVRS